MQSHAWMEHQGSTWAPLLLLLLHACTCIDSKSLTRCHHAPSYCIHARYVHSDMLQHSFFMHSTAVAVISEGYGPG